MAFARLLVCYHSQHTSIAFCGSFATGIPLPFSTLPAAFARALAERGYTNPTPVQAAVLAPETDERDLLVSAQTGSGKTVAYGLAMAATLLEDGALPRADGPLALIIAPTRELALQV